MNDTTRHTFRKLTVKFLLLVAVLAVADLVYRYTLYPRDLKEHSGMMELSQLPVDEDADIIYLGESSNHNCNEADTDRRPISQMIEDQLPGHRVAALVKNATHAGVFYDIMNNVPRRSPVRIAVVTVNMRSFTSEWIWSNLETPLRKEQVLMKRGPALYKRMLLAFKAYPQWTEDERWDIVRRGIKRQTFTMPYDFPWTDAGEWDHDLWHEGTQNGRAEDTLGMACHYVKCFACSLDDDNPRIRDFDRIVKLCRRRGWQPVFHILPDNEEQIAQMVGPDLLWLMHHNAAYVKQRYEAMGVVVVDNQGLVADSCFNDREYPTEHYNQEGRRAIADAVAAAVRQLEIAP